jgi:hypothetical protein
MHYSFQSLVAKQLLLIMLFCRKKNEWQEDVNEDIFDLGHHEPAKTRRFYPIPLIEFNRQETNRAFGRSVQA